MSGGAIISALKRMDAATAEALGKLEDLDSRLGKVEADQELSRGDPQAEQDLNPAGLHLFPVVVLFVVQPDEDHAYVRYQCRRVLYTSDAAAAQFDSEDEEDVFARGLNDETFTANQYALCAWMGQDAETGEPIYRISTQGGAASRHCRRRAKQGGEPDPPDAQYYVEEIVYEAATPPAAPSIAVKSGGYSGLAINLPELETGGHGLSASNPPPVMVYELPDAGGNVHRIFWEYLPADASVLAVITANPLRTDEHYDFAEIEVANTDGNPAAVWADPAPKPGGLTGVGVCLDEEYPNRATRAQSGGGSVALLHDVPAGRIVRVAPTIDAGGLTRYEFSAYVVACDICDGLHQRMMESMEGPPSKLRITYNGLTYRTPRRGSGIATPAKLATILVTTFETNFFTAGVWAYQSWGEGPSQTAGDINIEIGSCSYPYDMDKRRGRVRHWAAVNVSPLPASYPLWAPFFDNEDLVGQCDDPPGYPGTVLTPDEQQPSRLPSTAINGIKSASLATYGWHSGDSEVEISQFAWGGTAAMVEVPGVGCWG